jgi:DNA repair protein RecN (Recombination protein N)
VLEELVVEGLGVIERAEVELSSGSTALTGETGAGKTLVVSALGLLLGGRADRGALRSGNDRASIEGRFTVAAGHPSIDRLLANGLLEQAPENDIEIVVSRVITPNSNKVRINSRLVTLTVLAEVMSSLVEIAGQNEHHRLTHPAYQRGVLDRYAGERAIELAETVAARYRESVEASRELSALREGDRQRQRELDMLRHEIDEIRAAGLIEGEIEALHTEIRRQESSQDIAGALDEAVTCLSGDDGAATAAGRARAALASVSQAHSELNEAVARLETIEVELTELARDLVSRVVEPDPGALEAARARMDVISKLRRKYGDSEAEIIGHLQRSEERVLELDDTDSQIQMWEKKLQTARVAAVEAARELSALRRTAATRLRDEMSMRLRDLALGSAVFEAAFEERELYEGGLEQVTFIASTNRGETPRPIAKAASGGELSRMALALNLCVSADHLDTVVFDEVDAGVGGAAARSVGAALSELASATRSQVLVVTHLPQVAAAADNHLMVRKASSDGRTTATVEVLSREQRVEELSRMLAGLPDSELGRKHAEELLELSTQGSV